MRKLQLTINNVPVARFEGEQLNNRPSALTQWTRFSTVDLRAPEGWLRFEVEDETPDEAPSGMSADKDEKRVSNLQFDNGAKNLGGDTWEIIPARPLVFLRFRWRNPLTPASEGSWFRIVLQRIKDQLFVVPKFASTEPVAPQNRNADSRIWTFQSGKKDWESTAAIEGNQGLSIGEFARRLANLEYAAADGDDCALLMRGNRRSIVEARGIDKPRRLYRLAFLIENGQDVHPLAAKFAAPAAAYPVSGNLLRTENRSAASLDANAIDLTCARLADRSGFVVEWSGIGGEPSNPEELSLNTLYQAYARHYALGMASARSRNRLSFAPTRLAAIDKPIRLQFDVSDAPNGATTLRQVVVDKDTNIEWTTGAAGEPGKAVVLSFDQDGATSSLRKTLAGEKPPLAILHVAGTGKSHAGSRWVVNGVALDVDTFERAKLTIRQTDGADVYGQSPVAVGFELDFSKAAMQPVSDDPEIGFETLSSWLDRERPVVIDVREKPFDARLEIREFANETQSRILRIQVQSIAKQKTDYVIDAVVLDPSPLTAARVRSTTSIDPEGLIAEYTDDSDQAPEWAFTSGEGEMRVALPPQVIGEEMIKGRLNTIVQGADGTSKRKEVPFADAPFDFRLSPNARLTLDRTDIDTARALAPWSLRRLLGQRPGVVGAKLVKAQFELLYGLTTEIEDISGLRVAELDALVGRIPFPDEFLELLRAARELESGGSVSPDKTVDPRLRDLRTNYAAEIAGAIKRMLYRPSWWPVFRDFTSRQQTTITGKGVTSMLRPSRATASPFEIHNPHDASTVKDSRAPLRGGVDWPFQSRAVYEELRSKPRSSGVTVEGLAFGSLGGWGKQTAEFNNGKTLIISETTQGRLDSVTVIRIGRIAMLWNRARHVIVYERSTRRAPRYKLAPNPDTGDDTWEFQSDAFDGFAALRKVREYIEITEQKRNYPDTTTAQPIAGPLKASFFETTIIPVKSTWGRDVASGFVIALRGPLRPEEARFFPCPKIFLKQARARGKGEGTVDHQLKDPGELLFYTSTREEDGGDSDLWPAVADIDFPVIRPTAALPLPFKSRFSRMRRQPDARIADFGQRRFTITVDPPEEAVDLMHGRLSAGIEARISTVSLARGRISAAAHVPAGGIADKVAGPMAVTHAILHDGLSELRMQIAQARADGVQSLADAPQFAAEARALVAELRKNATELAANTLPADVPFFKWSEEQQEWNRKYNANLDGQFETWKRQTNLEGVADADKPRVKLAVLESACQQIHQRINEAGFLPLQALNRIDVAHEALKKRRDELTTSVLGSFNAAVDRVAARFSAIVAAAATDEDEDAAVPGLVELQNEVDAVLLDFTATLADFDSSVLKNFADGLGEWFSTGATGFVADVAKIIRERAGDLRLVIADILTNVPPVDLAEPDWAQLKKDCATVVEAFANDLVTAVETLIAELRKPVQDLLGENGRLEVLNDADKAVKKACDDVVMGTKKIEEFLATAKDALKAIGGELDTKLKNLGAKWTAAPGPFDKVGVFKTDAAKWFRELNDRLSDAGSLEEVEKALTAATRTIADALEGAAKQVERAVVGELRNLGNEISAAGLEITRVLATGPVNDAIACTRDQLGYYYDAARDALDVTRASALFNDLGGTVLNALSAELPFDRIRDRLLPQLQGLDLGQLLPNFGGLKLEHLFPDLKAPDDGSDNDWIRIRHGFDKDRLTAFADVDVDKVIEGTPAVFILPPISLKVRSAHFLASSRLEMSSAGGKSQSTKAALNADWLLCLSDRPIVTIKRATLRFDSDGGFDFDFNSEDVELADEFQFITQALQNLLPQDEGLTLTPIMPAGIRAELALPLPDLTTGAFTLTGITLYTFMELLIAEGFEVRTGFWLSKPERPFGLAILFLGGGGWVGIEVRYRPPDRFVSRVSVGISAGAFVAVNFGVARGSAGILFTAGVDFFRNSETQSGQTLITLGVLVWGEFSILGIASASLRMMMSVTYDADNGSMFGTGRVEVSIRICWCFTLKVSQQVRQNFIGKKREQKQNRAALPPARDKFSTAVRAVHSNVAL